MRKTTTRSRTLLPLGAVLALVVAFAVAASVASAKSTLVPTVGYKLTAKLGPVAGTSAPATASGHFNAVLVKTGPGLGRAILSAGCKIVVPRSPRPPLGIRTPIGIVCPGGLRSPLPALGRSHWVLVWRLTFSGLSGPASAAHVHISLGGNAAVTALPLCGPCTVGIQSHLTVSADQATALVNGNGRVTVSTAANPGGEISGQIVRTRAFFPAL